MDSHTLGGVIRDSARREVKPGCREARVSQVTDARVLVTVRSLLGDTNPEPVEGVPDHVREAPGGGLELYGPTRGDRMWVTDDEQGGLVCVQWKAV